MQARSITCRTTHRTRGISSPHPAVSVSPRAVEDRRLHAAAQSLLDLPEQAGRRAVERHAVAGPVEAVARGARRAHRLDADGRDGDPRLLRAAVDMARPAAAGQACWVVIENLEFGI